MGGRTQPLEPSLCLPGDNRGKLKLGVELESKPGNPTEDAGFQEAGALPLPVSALQMLTSKF